MAAVRPNQALKAKAIYFSDGKVLTDKIILITDNFLIVAKDENDTAPNWYNITTVDRMENVDVLRNQSRGRLSVF